MMPGMTDKFSYCLFFDQRDRKEEDEDESYALLQLVEVVIRSRLSCTMAFLLN